VPVHPNARRRDAGHPEPSSHSVSKRKDWKPGERIGRSKSEDMLIAAVIEPEEDADFYAYLVVSSLGDNGASETDNP
jgi:hypothetical protein